MVQLVFVWAYERLTGRRGMGEGDAKLLLAIGAFLGWEGALFAIVAGAVQGLAVALVAMATGRDLVPTQAAERDEAESEGSAVDGNGSAAQGEHSDTARDEADDDDERQDEDEEAEGASGDHAGHFKVPFGPFLALASLEFLFFGDRIVAWYFGLFR